MVKTRQSAASEILPIGYNAPSGSRALVELLTHSGLLARRPTAEMESLQRADFHVIIVCIRGMLRHTVDFTTVTLRKGGFVHVHPGQVQRWNPAERGEGRVVVFPRDPRVSLTAPWFAGGAPDHRRLDARQLAQVIRSLDDIDDEQQQATASPAILTAALTLLLHRLYRSTAVAGAVPDQPPPPAYLVYRQEIEVGIGRSHSVCDYAIWCGYSERTLARACVRVTGQTAKQVLDQRIMLEGRRLLSHTDAPIAQIARELGYPDATNFTKAFRRVTGVGPLQFRIGLSQ